MRKVTKAWLWIVAVAVLLCGIVFILPLLGKEKGADRVALALGQTYQNPFVLEQEWEDYGIGDPYVLRYDGKYFLYCSTKDRRVGIKAWSSDDLVNWRYEGLVTEEPISEGAYAPEVVYWNGSFYMYTSPAGKGHYVLQSDKPTGPFVKKTDNLGFTIDGSVFIDDDEKWYFTHAKFDGIMASVMADPYTIGPDKQLNTTLGHWTEGSMIIKRNGRYFMTYTGNHVFSKGYRVNYGVNHDSPIGTYTIPENNPILISTVNDFNGLGHSATVMGPDMDSYYMVYHNLVGRSAEGPPVRKLNLDRLVFNGDKMSVLGPTHGSPQEAPRMPEFHDVPGTGEPSADKWERLSPAGGSETMLTRIGTGSQYTAEYNVRLTVSSNVGKDSTLDAIFAYTDKDNYRVARMKTATMELSLVERVGGVEKIAVTKPLPKGTDLTKLHTIRIESGSLGTMVYWDGLLKIEQVGMAGNVGRIGYAWPQGAKPELHYTAFANDAYGSSDQKIMKPLPGTMEAVHGIKNGGANIQSGISPDGSDVVMLSKSSDSIAFPVNVQADGRYLLSANVSKASAGSTLVIEVNGESKRIKLEASLFASDSAWSKVPLGEFEITKGPQWLVVHGAKDEVTVGYVEVSGIVAVPEESVIKPTAVGLLNRFGGDPGWTDYTVSFDVTLKATTSDEIGVLLRTTNESNFKDQVKDAFMGYALVFRNDKLVLRRVNYEQAADMTTGTLAFKQGQTRKINVKMKGASLAVYSDEDSEPILMWRDPNAFLHGRVGLRGVSSAWVISPLTIAKLK